MTAGIPALGAGFNEFITAEQTARAEARFAEVCRVAMLGGDHVWTAVLAHLVQDPVEFRSGQYVLDHETLVAMPSLGCYLCEEPYTELLAKRRCKPVTS